MDNRLQIKCKVSAYTGSDILEKARRVGFFAMELGNGAVSLLGWVTLCINSMSGQRARTKQFYHDRV